MLTYETLVYLHNNFGALHYVYNYCRVVEYVPHARTAKKPKKASREGLDHKLVLLVHHRHRVCLQMHVHSYTVQYIPADHVVIWNLGSLGYCILRQFCFQSFDQPSMYE